MEYDVFISHASEDKGSFVEPLAKALQEAGLKVWYDNFELKWGDSLREKIDYGLANSRYGVVVLSKSFFAKEWPQTELDSLVTRQNSEGNKVILPIWHEVSVDEVRSFSPILASKLAVRSSDGIDNIVGQIIDVCNTDDSEPRTVFQTSKEIGLREQCLAIIRSGDILEWRKLVDRVSGPIPEQLKEWKNKEGEAAGHQGGEAWKKAVPNAVEICLPGFVPIFSSVEAGKIEYWRESIGMLRRLALLKEEMIGGLVIVSEIGLDMLPIAGYLGLSIAASLKLFDFVNEWMYLKLPGRSQGYNREISWMNILAINQPRMGNIEDPFAYLRFLSQTNLLKNFYEDEQRTVKNLFLGNLLASLLELRETALNPKECEAMVKGSNEFHVEVAPVWCIMDRAQFQTSTLDLFGDSQSTYNYVFPKHEKDIKEFWSLWRRWKKVCADFWYPRLRFGSMIYNMTLPGEPPAYT